MVEIDVRRDILNLCSTEKENLVSAILELKRKPSKVNPPPESPFPKPTNRYDDFVMMHLLSFSRDPSRMLSHGSPTFLPWHRAFLRLFERELQKIGPEFSNVTLPYWDWTNPDSEKVLWSEDLMGGNGRVSDGRVMDGQFAYDKGNWTLYTVSNIDSRYERQDLARRFGLYIEDGQQYTVYLPSSPFVIDALRTDPYDKEPWDDSDYISFRTALEGWYGHEHIHNMVHAWVGGQIIKTISPNIITHEFAGTMSHGGSPNDPVFWLHHSNIDRLWADWQLDPLHWNLEYKGYLPIDTGPKGFRANDSMIPWENISPAKVANFYSIDGKGYMYEKYYRTRIKDIEGISHASAESMLTNNVDTTRELNNINIQSASDAFNLVASKLSMKNIFSFKDIKKSGSLN